MLLNTMNIARLTIEPSYMYHVGPVIHKRYHYSIVEIKGDLTWN